jgi:hypothetical protein
MPLQIRRGTDAERLAMTQPLAQGELLFVSTPGAERLYIGNGSTLGGIQITGYTNADAKDAAAASFTGGTHSGITFTYNTTTDLISANVDLSNYQGVLRGDLIGSVFADDSSLLVDAVAGIIPAAVVSGTFTGNVVGNVTGNTTGYHTGDVKGSVFADDSTLLVDAVSGTISATSITGNIFTNLIDSANSSAITFTPAVIFNSDVTVENDLIANLTGNIRSPIGETIIDNATRTAGFASVGIDTNGSIFGNNLFISGGPPGVTLLTVDTVLPDTPVFKFLNNNESGVHTASVGLLRGRGTVFAPTTVISGDEIGDILSCGFDGVQYLPATSISTIVDGPVSPGVVPSRIEIYTTNVSGVAGLKLTVGSTAVQFTVPPNLPVVANDTARTALVPTPATGMMIFMTAGSSPAATNKVQVYDSTAWVNLH